MMLPALIENFFRDAVKLQQDVQQALEQGKSEEIRRAAHTLKSASQNFGAMVLAELCQQLENQGKSGKLEHADELLTQIVAEYENAKVALGNMLK